MKNLPVLPGLVLLLLLLTACPQTPLMKAKASARSAYVGTYTRDEGWVNGQAQGIYQLDLDGKGRIIDRRLAVAVPNPSFVVESEALNRYLYAVSELARADEPTGFLHVYDVAENFREIAKLPTNGKAPCHLELDRSEEFLITCNYVGGVATLFRHPWGGAVTEVDRFAVPAGLVPGKQPHLHAAQFAPDNQLVAIADLGLDRVWLFTLDRDARRLRPHPQTFVPLAPGAGPRHMQWSADGRFLYVINELNSTLSVIRRDAETDRLTVDQTLSTLPDGWSGKNACADLHLHPSGKFLYGSNRGHNSIVSFRVDLADGSLRPLAHTPTRGDFPRNFAISPRGRHLYVANQNSGTITVFRLNEKNGALTFAGQEFRVPTPVCLEF